MMDILTTPEAVAVLCLLMVGADEDVRQEELASMLANPFFQEHVADKIWPHDKFIRSFNTLKANIGKNALEAKAVSTLKSAFPAMRIKTLALMTQIAGADGDYAQSEKELVVRISTALGIAINDVDQELEKMRVAVRETAKKAEATNEEK